MIYIRPSITSAIRIAFIFAFYATAATAATPPETKTPFKFALGQQKYLKSCAGCHGDALQGTKIGPPLLHPYYRPDHHNDDSFYRAILQGVRAHHWQFGDMPAVPGVTRQDVDAIVPFVRWFQQEKGLF